VPLVDHGILTPSGEHSSMLDLFRGEARLHPPRCAPRLRVLCIRLHKRCTPLHIADLPYPRAGALPSGSDRRLAASWTPPGAQPGAPTQWRPLHVEPLTFLYPAAPSRCRPAYKPVPCGRLCTSRRLPTCTLRSSPRVPPPTNLYPAEPSACPTVYRFVPCGTLRASRRVQVCIRSRALPRARPLSLCAAPLLACRPRGS
jgi:hypothetical protein